MNNMTYDNVKTRVKEINDLSQYLNLATADEEFVFQYGADAFIDTLKERITDWENRACDESHSPYTCTCTCTHQCNNPGESLETVIDKLDSGEEVYLEDKDLKDVVKWFYENRDNFSIKSFNGKVKLTD